MSTITNVTCCGIDADRLIRDLKQYNDPKETVNKAEIVFRCLMDGKSLTTCYFQMDNDFKQLQQCNDCLHEKMLSRCNGVLSCSGVFYTIANDIETMLDCSDLYPIVRPTTDNYLDSVVYAQQFINAKMLAQNSIYGYTQAKFDEKGNAFMDDFTKKYFEYFGFEAGFSKMNNTINRSATKQFCSIKSIEQSADHKTVAILWTDGDKTIVKRSKNDPDDIYMAFTAALAKKIYGSNSAIKREISKKLNEHKAKAKKVEPKK